jgi:hypothetical protein
MLALALHNVTTFDSVHLISNNGGAAAAVAADMRDENAVSSKSSHLSITLPCKKLLRSSSGSSYNITVVYMNDFCSVNKCFLGIISPRKEGCSLPLSPIARCCNSVVSSSSLNEDDSDDVEKAANNKSADSKKALPCGKILQVDDDLLFNMIKRA